LKLKKFNKFSDNNICQKQNKILPEDQRKSSRRKSQSRRISSMKMLTTITSISRRRKRKKKTLTWPGFKGRGSRQLKMHNCWQIE